MRRWRPHEQDDEQVFSESARPRGALCSRSGEGASSRWAAVTSIATKIGCTAQSLNEWVKKAEVDSGVRAGLPTEVAEKLKALERENRELRQANEILRKASAYFAMAELDRRFKPSSRSSTITATRMGSSRSARCCRWPRRPAGGDQAKMARKTAETHRTTLRASGPICKCEGGPCDATRRREPLCAGGSVAYGQLRPFSPRTIGSPARGPRRRYRRRRGRAPCP